MFETTLTGRQTDRDSSVVFSCATNKYKTNITLANVFFASFFCV